MDANLSGLQLGIQEIAMRLACAMLIGAVIGFEREYTHRPAGLRTHMLVAIGSCAVMITSQVIFVQYRTYGATLDPTRLSAQIISGIGFLGAGTILREGAIVKGLTTAASIWSVACLSIAVGAGYYDIGLIGLGFILVTLTLFDWVQKKLFNNHFLSYTFTVKCTNIVQVLEKINDMINLEEAKLHSIEVEDNQDGSCKIIFHADFVGRNSKKRHEEFIGALVTHESVLSVSSER